MVVQQAKLPSHFLATVHAAAAEAPEPKLHLPAVESIADGQVATAELQTGTAARMGVAKHS